MANRDRKLERIRRAQARHVRPLWEHLGSDRRAVLASAALSQIEAQP